jgi:AraC-like DNA-binding protein
VLSFIQANLGLDLRQKQVAQAVKMSPQSFSRFFKRFVGMTYIAYVNELRVRRVCRALLDSDETIAEAAYAAGFNNLSHFNCQFRRVKRMSPREYRRLARA